MFQRAVIRGMAGYPGVDLGLVAETLLFYKEVHLAFDAASLREFIKSAGIIPTLDLLGRHGVSASFTPQHVVVQSNPQSGLEWHTFAQIALIRKADGRKVSSGDKLVEAIAEGGSLSSNARRVELVRRKIKITDLPSGEASIPHAARALMADRSLVHDLPRAVLAEVCPQYQLPPQYRFNVVGGPSGFAIDTDIPFAEINAIYHQSVSPSHSTLSTAYILSHLISARCDAYFSASKLAELVTTPVHASLIRRQVHGLMEKRDGSVTQHDLFEDVAFPEGKSLREVINSGARSFSDFLILLDKSEKFRDWLHAADPDTSVVRQYLLETSSSSWLESLPAKIFRFGIVSAIGAAANPAVGLGVGAFDALIIDPLGKGWRPSQFIAGPLKRFVSV